MMESDPIQRRAQRWAVATQCLGAMGLLALNNGLLLGFSGRLGLDGESTLRLLGLPSLISAVVTIPLAYLSDRFGGTKIGGMGIIGSTLGFSLLALAGLLDASIAPLWIGVILISIGYAAFSASWFSILEPLVPAPERGRFFGRLRISWQGVGVVFGLLIALILDQRSERSTFVVIWAVIAFLQLPRQFTYRQVPDRTQRLAKGTRLRDLLATLLRRPDYLPYGAYLFLLSLSTGSALWLFGLLQSRVMHFGEGKLVLFGNIAALGNLAGFWLGGRLVDRYGTKPVFLIAHFGYACVLALVLMRHHLPFGDFPLMAIAVACWGVVLSCSGIATTTEAMALAPEQGRALAISSLTTLGFAGSALAAWAASHALSLGLIRDGWTLWGATMTSYDGLLLLACFAVLTVTVTLGLVPSVLRKAQWVP
jgi:MFS family permease